ncbi:hypothetical protein HF1_08720 [Mycoplasma haemofelis str. Langford 1]|uniref:Uncharacterized protein n=1 Tax=Mycoplasma haemofelis (strain Langford 1) TaxID=941640 RepID=E8ZIA9_MYCHL|nr:hypothetical protein [Mycoplasma haemofelis]CBY92880.1 hypothetical protein HF1_08720 [Mycoplasma haemofelis str. Langford 1]
MSKFTAASIAGLGGAAGIGGGVYLLNKDSENKSISKPEKETIQSRLQKEKFQILTSDASQWSEIKTQYNSKKDDASKVFAISNSEVQESVLKDLCRENLSKSEFDDSLYSKVKRWCVVPTTISSHLKLWGITSLPTDESKEEQKDKWEELAKKYDAASNKIKDLNSLSDEKWKSLRTKCKSMGEKKNYEDDFDSFFESSKIWCASDGSNSPSSVNG